MQKCEIHFFGPQKMRYTKRIKVQSYSSMIRSYHREYISSRLITEIKHDWAATVVPTEMGCEVAVTNLLLVKHSFNNLCPSCAHFAAPLLLCLPLLKIFQFCRRHPNN